MCGTRCFHNARRPGRRKRPGRKKSWGRRRGGAPQKPDSRCSRGNGKHPARDACRSRCGKFCRSQGCEFVVDPATYYITAIGVTSEETIQNELSHGTVGAVALDMNGRLASATSTGGVFGKLEGRVGDTPLIGAGTWADEYVAASCTGLGEFFILAGGAQDIASRVRYQGADLNQAAQGLIRDVGRQGGNGGVICLSRDGDIGFAWNSGGMKRAGVGPNNPLFAATF
ncbi:MAG: isoaspartyl peptidase/L-asparaginase [Parvularculaceae bacterium]